MRYLLIVLLWPTSALASDISIGPLGIDAVGLSGPGDELLNGTGVKIGQSETVRPADPQIDASTTFVNSTIDPTQVTVSRVTPAAGNFGQAGNSEFNFLSHATNVANVLISTGSNNAGVAPGSELYADAIVNHTIEMELLSLQFLSRIGIGSGNEMRAINNSWGHEIPFAFGSSQLTMGVDWIASRYNTLLVFAVNDVGRPDHDAPGDNFNGITVGASERVESMGAYRRAAALDDPDVDPEFNHYEIDLIAPGVNIQMTGLNDVPADDVHNDGSSFAAPHVVGTVALLQQYADLELARPGTDWDSTAARRHEVMKAVLLNSADKINGVQGSNRTVEDFVGNTWIDSQAYLDAEVPLDPFLGAGHLNARRALKQFAAGPQGFLIDPLGWHYGETGGLGTIHEFPFSQTLSGWVSITLAWDAPIEKLGGSESIYGSGETSSFQMD